jgi:hypothetical protein
MFHPPRTRLIPVIAALFGAVGFLLMSTRAQTFTPRSASPRQGRTATLPAAVKPDAKKAKEAFKQGLRAEHDGDWQTALEAYTDAANWAPGDPNYLLRREIARSRLVQAKVDLAEREAVSGRIAEARRELLAARALDPSNSVVRDRLAELLALEPVPAQQLLAEAEPGGEIHLKYQLGNRNFDYRGDTQGAYGEVAHQFGVEVAFDVDLHSVPVRMRIPDVDFLEAMQVLGNMTGTFWRPLTKHLLFVAENTAQKRREYGGSVVRTVLFPASETPEQMTEILRVVREIAGITRSDLDPRSRTLTMRASQRAVAVASNLIENLEKPVGELVLEIEILEVDRNRALQLGLTPPQKGQIFTLSKAEVLQALQSPEGLVSVLTQIFGQPSSLSGLSATQIASLLSSGQINITSLIPPLIAFGGGATTFLATLPGAAAHYSGLLSLVQNGRRILLRAEDGQPATFFVGDRIPVTLAQFSSSLAGVGSNVPGLLSTNFPTTELATGKAPAFLTVGDLRNKQIQDLIVANHADNTLSILLGNGDGTFQSAIQPPPQTGTGPAWVATAEFNNDNFLDLAVANQTQNTISIFLGKGDGTFQPRTDIPTGAGPISVVAADLNGDGKPDLAVANHADNTLSIFLGNGDGTFKPPTVVPTGARPSAIAAADFNKDGKMDLAVTNQDDDTVSIFLGNGDGTFKNRVDYPTGKTPLWVSTGDFRGDTILDLAVANNTDDTVSILLGLSDANGNANGTFGPRTDFPAGRGPTSIAVADYNIDGRLDLAVADQNDNAVSVLLGLGGGLFGPNFELPVGSNPVSIVTADFNGDNRPDAATANMGSDNASVIINSSRFTVGNSFTGSLFPGVQYLDIGVKVKATPRIHQNNEVTLQLQLEISSLANQSFNGIPVIANQSVEQTVRLEENETTALAGILEPQESRSTNGTPGIAGLSGFGLLGGRRTLQNQDSELLILITPRLVRLAERKDHMVYAGSGAQEGRGAIGPTEEERRTVPPPPP